MNTHPALLPSRLLLIALLVGAALAWPGQASAQICNAEAHKWVAAQGKDLPRSYEEISELPENYRRAVYAVLEPETRSELWQKQFELYLGREGDLSEAQRAVLLEAIQLTTPDAFAAAENRRHWTYRQMIQRVKVFEERARAAFGTKAGSLFAMIGAPGDETAAVVTPYCNCSDQSDWCSTGVCNIGGCIKIEDDCGTFLMFDCDGLCGPDAEVIQ